MHNLIGQTSRHEITIIVDLLSQNSMSIVSRRSNNEPQAHIAKLGFWHSKDKSTGRLRHDISGRFIIVKDL